MKHKSLHAYIVLIYRIINYSLHVKRHVTRILLKRKLDLLIILVKQYIYSKYLQKELSLDEIVNKLTVQRKLEKCAQT